MKSLRIQPAAVDDAEAAADWYETQQHGLGTEFILQVDAAIERATERPDAFELQYRSLRRVLMRRFPYAVYFLLERDIVEVVAVLHQHGDPVAWQSRV